MLPNWSVCKKIFLLGYPIGMQFGGELAAMTVATYFMGYFGVTALAASQIVSQYALLIIMITLGLSQALSILISEAYGKKDVDLIKRYIISAVIILSSVFVLVVIVFLSIPKYLIGIFIHNNGGDNAAIIYYAIIFFILSAIVLFIDGLRNLFSAGLRGLHDSKAPMYVGIFCIWIISLPMSYVIGFQFDGGPIGLRIGFISGFAVATIILWGRLRNKVAAIVDNKTSLARHACESRAEMSLSERAR